MQTKIKQGMQIKEQSVVNIFPIVLEKLSSTPEDIMLLARIVSSNIDELRFRQKFVGKPELDAPHVRYIGVEQPDNTLQFLFRITYPERVVEETCSNMLVCFPDRRIIVVNSLLRYRWLR